MRTRSVRWAGVVTIALLASPRTSIADPPPAPSAPPTPAPAPGAVPPAPGAPPPAPPAAPTPPPAQGANAAPPKAPEPPHMRFDEGTIRKADGVTDYFYRTNFLRADELVKTVTTLLTITNHPKLTAVARAPQPAPQPPGPSGNEVIIEGTPEEIETALSVFAYFDVPDPQVYVEAKIIEVTYDNNFEFGFSSSLDRDSGPNTFFRGEKVTLNPPSFLQSQLPGNLPFQGAGMSFGFVGEALKKYGDFDLTLQALQRNGTAEILSRPSIVATEGIESSVMTEQKTPILSVRQSQSLTPPEHVPAGFSFVPAGAYGTQVNLTTDYVTTTIGLKVLPILIGDGFVKLHVMPQVSTVTGFSVGQGVTSAPIISDRKADTTITMADGETLVIGGLYTDTTLKDTAKIPFLGDIPCLGALFARVRDSKVKTELMFHITPHILRKKTDYKVIAPPGEKERLQETCPAPGSPDAR